MEKKNKPMIYGKFLLFYNSWGKRIFFTFSLIVFSFAVFAQDENKYIRKGNSQYDEGKYIESQANYLKALEHNSKSFSGAFNLADALYKQESYEEAAAQFNVLSQSAPDKILKAKALHNQGNSLLKANKFEESITAYKNSLKNNPADDETRYNLAYAQQKLLQQQQQQQKQDEKKEDKKEDKKDKEEKKDEKQEEQKDKQEEQKEQEPKKDQLSKEEAQRLLDAMNNEEKKVQEKLNKKKSGVKVQIEKDW